MGLDDTPELYYRDGTPLSIEEQRPLHQLRMIQSPVRADLWAHRHDPASREARGLNKVREDFLQLRLRIR